MTAAPTAPLPDPADEALGTLAALADAGWATTYTIVADGIEGPDGVADADEFTVWRQYRFEGRSDPDDEVILLALEHRPSGELGVVHAAFGHDATAAEARIFRQLARAERH